MMTNHDILTELKIIKQWIFDNHQHHEDGEDGETHCVNGDRPYVDSLEVEKLIDGLIEKVER